MGDELTLYFCTGGGGNALCKWSSAIDRTVTDRHTTFPLFWRQLCLLINKYNTNLYQRFQGKGSNLLEQFVLVIRDFPAGDCCTLTCLLRIRRNI